MYVCICNAVTDRMLREALAEADAESHDYCTALALVGCAPECGRCKECVESIIDEVIDQQDAESPTIFKVM